MAIGMQKLSAGSGYEYLTRSQARVSVDRWRAGRERRKGGGKGEGADGCPDCGHGGDALHAEAPVVPNTRCVRR